MTMFLLVSYFFCFSVIVNCHENPQVIISDGKLEGTHMKTKEGREIRAFQGIPYAEPPLDELRFKSPVPRKPWVHMLNATQPHASCPQLDILTGTGLMGEEDCLYLNVYTPKLPSSTFKPLPVMVFLHGGGFFCGSARSDFYGPGLLLDQDIVLVTANYRLGALGFLSTGDDVSPGNYGLKDQTLALKWVNKNIKYFGGDPDSVTLFGESAGGASSHFHILSPLSKGLFKAVISQSGTSSCIWATTPRDESIRISKKFAEHLGCPTRTNTEMVDCLRNVEALKLADHRILSEWDISMAMPFTPVVEPPSAQAFLTDTPLNLFKSKNFNDVPWMTGLTKEEGLIKAAVFAGKPDLFGELNQDFHSKMAILLSYKSLVENPNQISAQLRKFYFGDKKRLTFENDFSNFTNMLSDVFFTKGLDDAVRMHLKTSRKPVYNYLFAYQSGKSFSQIMGDPGRIHGVSHGDDLFYLFPLGDVMFSHINETDDDKRITKLMTTLWTNFAKTGNPTPVIDDLIIEKWEPVKSEKLEHYFIDAKSQSMRDELFPERIKLCRSLVLESTNIKKDEL